MPNTFLPNRPAGAPAPKPAALPLPLLCVLLLSFVALAPSPGRAYDPNLLGLFYDAEATVDQIETGPNAQHALYLVLLNPVNDGYGGSGTRDVGYVSGFECGIEPPTGDFLLGVDFPVAAVNVGSADNLVVGFAAAVPVGTGRTATLATLRVLTLGNNRDGYLLSPASTPSIAGAMAYVDAEDTDDNLVAMMPVSGAFDRAVFWFGNWNIRQTAPWGAVKSLFR